MKVVQKTRRAQRRKRQTTQNRGRSSSGGARALSARAPARFFGAAKRRTEIVTEGGETFEILTILSPGASAAMKAEAKGLFKDNRLEITDKNIEDHLDAKDYDAIISVRNTGAGKADRAIGTLQHEAWCSDDGVKQLWVHDISRINTRKESVSPVKILMDYIKRLAAEFGQSTIYLLVDEEDKVSKPANGTWKGLTGLYERAYGYSTNVSGCVIGDHSYTVMKTAV
jgi:hypothetical protein